jgi:hypothetical protein
VRSVRASWTVVRILAESGGGVAATWIGAQTASAGASSPFIQVGINEERVLLANGRLALDAHYAFWSDTALHFRPIPLFAVKPGDRISASLTLKHGRWLVAISDPHAHRSASLSTAEEAHGSLNVAEWFQEDVTDGLTHRPFPYPQLSPTVFTKLTVNAAAPRYGNLLSQWMSANGTDLGPTPLVDDSFAVSPMALTPAGRRYLALADRQNRASNAFAKQFRRWSPETPRKAIHREQVTYASALRSFLEALAKDAWPSDAQTAIDRLIAANSRLLAQVETDVPTRAGGLQAWRRAVIAHAQSVSHAARHVRRVLGLPQIS